MPKLRHCKKIIFFKIDKMTRKQEFVELLLSFSFRKEHPDFIFAKSSQKFCRLVVDNRFFNKEGDVRISIYSSLKLSSSIL